MLVAIRMGGGGEVGGGGGGGMVTWILSVGRESSSIARGDSSLRLRSGS